MQAPSTSVDPKEAAGNWKKFDNFCWDNEPEDGDHWTIINLTHRDANLLDTSNADAIREAMRPYLATDDVRFEQFTHWAFGWVEGISVRVFGPDGNTTEAWRTLEGLAERLREYPALDEDDYCRREYEATLDNIDSVVSVVVCRYDHEVKLPDDADRQIFSWLWDHDQRSLESVDGQGGHPGEAAVEAAMKGLGFLQ